jgi:signal transduction histidine kinase
VTDDGTGIGDSGPNADGHGLLGMRERVALFGGTLETGARSDGPGYVVHAVLPL